MVVRLLGRFEVWRDGALVPEAAWRGQKPRDLLKILVLSRGRFVSQDELCDWLWPEAEPAAARANLRSAVRDLRKLLEPALERGRDSTYVVTRREGYAFNSEARVEVDVVEFETVLAAAPQPDRQTLEAALALYRGDLLEEDPYVEWAQAERDRLRLLRLEGLGRLADLCLAGGDARAAVQTCEQALALDAGRETLWRTLMRAYAANGDRAAALRAFDRCRAALARDLGVDPLPETLALHQQLLLEEPAGPGLPAVAAKVPLPPRWLLGLGAAGIVIWVAVTGLGLVASLAGALGGAFVSRGDPGSLALPYLADHPEALAAIYRELYVLLPESLLLLPGYLAWFGLIRAHKRRSQAEAGPLAWIGLSLAVLDVSAQTMSQVVGAAQLAVVPPAYTAAPAEQRLGLITLWDALRQMASAFGLLSAAAGPLGILLLCLAARSLARDLCGRKGGFASVLIWAGVGLSAATLLYTYLAPSGPLSSFGLQAGLALAILTLVWFLGLAVFLWGSAGPAMRPAQ